jgi:hypothetical protein
MHKSFVLGHISGVEMYMQHKLQFVAFARLENDGNPQGPYLLGDVKVHIPVWWIWYMRDLDRLRPIDEKVGKILIFNRYSGYVIDFEGG